MRTIRLTIDDPSWGRISVAARHKGLSEHELLGRLLGELLDRSDGQHTTITPGDGDARVTSSG